MTAPARSWLYVPGDRPERIAKALASDADAVILDLEDAVAPAAKAEARRTVVATLAEGRRAYVRVNATNSPHGTADLAALAAEPGALAGVRLPKCEDPGELRRVADTLGVPVYPVLESALGVENAFALATAHPLVAGISLGEADLAADLRVTGGEGLAWPRSRVVVAARAAGLPSPVQSVWTAVRDLDGLRADTEQGRRAGFFGRSVIHPAQIPVVHEACAPDAEDVAWARSLVDAVSENDEAAWIDASGRFVDKAIVERALWLLAIAGENQHVKEGHPS
ncbi:CoA ester lyase [Prauserella sp. PE36]|uniref:HpcH/HpaI aldolase/citrate lyase family protein n=1 Tax=Prauserella sp. PE36 TaxID=1504709 RepID=UPI000D960E61|nr:CoA ester lyase [Prauserella sp. PE36]PXY25895.1 citrate lyase subunit beta [Prauserella coralliicola]RBM22207.1 CoA ester lyase [Prauserella sp. PE36]